MGWLAGLPFLIGPLFYLYVKHSLRNDLRLRRKDLLHLIPFVLYYSSLLPFLFRSSAQKVDLYQNSNIYFETINTLAVIVLSLLFTMYLVLALRKLKQHGKLMEHNFSYPERINHKWLTYLIIWCFVIFSTVVSVLFLKEILHVVAGIELELIFYFIVILFILFIGIYGIRYRGIFTENAVIVEDNEAKVQDVASYQKTGLKPHEAEAIHRQLIAYMDTNQPFLEPRLTLGSLAGQIDVSVHHLSQVINQFEGCNFYDFVNRHRVEHFKQLLLNPKYASFSLLALAFDSGFNSKSSFNQVFKRLTGKTPSQFTIGRQ